MMALDTPPPVTYFVLGGRRCHDSRNAPPPTRESRASRYQKRGYGFTLHIWTVRLSSFEVRRLRQPAEENKAADFIPASVR